MSKTQESGIQIRAARSIADLAAIKALFREYAKWLQIDGNFPNLESEIASLPGQYAPPLGELFLASEASGVGIGCVAVKPLDVAARCEMKRLYVRQTGRSKGAGHALVKEAVAFAVVAGYEEILLDTLPSMASAISIYGNFGFEQIAPYHAGPGPNALYFRKLLKSEGQIGGQVGNDKPVTRTND
jgi:ribosomal protein S18 acetylase RimI-like enzyme